MRDGFQVQLFDGDETLPVVGESNYQDALWSIVGEWRQERIRQQIVAILVAETDNRYDANAISVWVNGLRVGYLSRENASKYRAGLVALQTMHGMPICVAGVIAGGGLREDGRGQLGVFLSHDPTDFGLEPPAKAERNERRMRTGFSDALATDEADDSYDLGWFRDLPDDSLAAIGVLRQLLEGEDDPIDRHFMFAHLEQLLYRSRDTFGSALAEYDEACRAHDAEMDMIRDAMLLKWGSVPLLETYRQMAIRQQKAGDFEQALWWAERGLALYGESAARPEAVEDLRKRARTCQQKLLPPPPKARNRRREETQA
jgi:hypothetical protein